MNTLKNLVCANGFMIFCYVFDAILILAAISLFVWYYFKSSKMKSEQFRKDVINSINMLKELNVNEDRIIELIIKNYGLTQTEVKELLA